MSYFERLQKIDHLIEMYLRGICTREDVINQMNDLDRKGLIDDNDWANVCSVIEC